MILIQSVIDLLHKIGTSTFYTHKSNLSPSIHYAKKQKRYVGDLIYYVT